MGSVHRHTRYGHFIEESRDAVPDCVEVRRPVAPMGASCVQSQPQGGFAEDAEQRRRSPHDPDQDP